MNIHQTDEDGRTILHHTKGDISHLIEQGGDVNKQDEGGWTPLMCATSSGDFDKVRSILGAERMQINIRNENGCTAVHYAASKGWNDILSLVLQKDDINLNIQDLHSKHTPLLRAVINGHILCARRLVLRGCKVNTKDIEGNTAIHYAVMAENIDMVLFLAEHGARIDEENKEGKTPMDVASPFIRYRMEEEI